jgi:hypothetical protein
MIQRATQDTVLRNSSCWSEPLGCWPRYHLDPPPQLFSLRGVQAGAEQYPSGAINYVRRDGERPTLVNEVRIRENGHYALHAAIELVAHGRFTPGDALPVRGFQEQALLR